MVHAIELAWAAGFFDGEGSICLCRASGTKTGHRIEITIGQNDIRPLRRFQAAVGGIGKIYGPFGYSGHQYNYRVWRRIDAELIIDLLTPYLSPIKLDDAQKVFGF